MSMLQTAKKQDKFSCIELHAVTAELLKASSGISDSAMWFSIRQCSPEISECLTVLITQVFQALVFHGCHP